MICKSTGGETKKIKMEETETEEKKIKNYKEGENPRSSHGQEENAHDYRRGREAECPGRAMYSWLPRGRVP